MLQRGEREESGEASKCIARGGDTDAVGPRAMHCQAPVAPHGRGEWLPGQGLPPVGLSGPPRREKQHGKGKREGLRPYLAVPAAGLRTLQALGRAGGICRF